MAITSTNDVAAGLAAADNQVMMINKLSQASQTAARYCSMWRGSGIPGQAAIPTTSAICDKTTLGGWNFTSPDTGNGKELYIAGGKMIPANGGTTIEFHDRLVQMGGLSGIVTTAQTVSLVVSGVTSNLQARLGRSDLSDVMWWIEWYTATGATGVNFTVAVTYTDLSTGNIVIAPGASAAAGNLFRILPVAGKIIKQIDSVTLSATTGTAGNFGFTATRELIAMETTVANWMKKYNWMDLELTAIEDSACITMHVLPTTTSSGTLLGNLRVIHK